MNHFQEMVFSPPEVNNQMEETRVAIAQATPNLARLLTPHAFYMQVTLPLLLDQ
jgi:hypothetical protein